VEAKGLNGTGAAANHGDSYTAARISELSASATERLHARKATALIYLDVNGPTFPIAFFAAARAGIPLVPLNYRQSDEQLQRLLAKHPGALVSVPPYHIAAVANAITNLYVGGRAIVLEQFSGDEWLEVVRNEEITHALVVPTMLARIMVAAGGDRNVPSLPESSVSAKAAVQQVI
jgi:acyl-CoA synthetase (AMP-forming)/AMP-acid ligase II